MTGFPAIPPALTNLSVRESRRVSQDFHQRGFIVHYLDFDVLSATLNRVLSVLYDQPKLEDRLPCQVLTMTTIDPLCPHDRDGQRLESEGQHHRSAHKGQAVSLGLLTQMLKT